jgi:hypothetical protein
VYTHAVSTISPAAPGQSKPEGNKQRQVRTSVAEGQIILSTVIAAADAHAANRNDVKNFIIMITKLCRP